MVEVPGSSPVAPTISAFLRLVRRRSIVNIIHTVPTQGLRLTKSEATRAKLLDCTVQELLISGVDQIGFTAVARRANLSTGALYARYENSEELLIDVWSMRAEAALRQFIQDIVDAATSPEVGKPLERIFVAMDSQDPDLVAALALMLIARRNETLREVVGPPVREMFFDGVSVFPALTHVAAHLLGEIFVAKGFGKKTEGWEEFIPIFLEIGRHAVAGPVVMDRSQTPQSLSITDPTNLDEFDIRLFDALTEVIGVAGVDRATVSRIARRANVNPATIYMRYESKGALIRRCVEHYLAAVIAGYYALDDRVASGDSIVANMVHLFRARASKKSDMVRRFRLETLYAAWHDDKLRQVYADAYITIVKRDVVSLRPSDSNAGVDVFGISTFNRVSLFGYSLLIDLDLISADDELIHSIQTGVFNRLITG